MREQRLEVVFELFVTNKIPFKTPLEPRLADISVISFIQLDDEIALVWRYFPQSLSFDPL